MSDAIGKVFNELTVVSERYDSAKNGTQWTCRCSCGIVKEISSSHVKSGGTKSCGCKRSGPFNRAN